MVETVAKDQENLRNDILEPPLIGSLSVFQIGEYVSHTHNGPAMIL